MMTPSVLILMVFRRLFLLDNQPPFAPGARSSIRTKQAEKRHLADPSLACALLKLSPTGLIQDLETFGFLFEALCERDLRIYANCFDGELYHYRDYRDNEIDAVIELPDKYNCIQFAKFLFYSAPVSAAAIRHVRRQMRH